MPTLMQLIEERKARTLDTSRAVKILCPCAVRQTAKDVDLQAGDLFQLGQNGRRIYVAVNPDPRRQTYDQDFIYAATKTRGEEGNVYSYVSIRDANSACETPNQQPVIATRTLQTRPVQRLGEESVSTSADQSIWDNYIAPNLPELSMLPEQD